VTVLQAARLSQLSSTRRRRARASGLLPFTACPTRRQELTTFEFTPEFELEPKEKTTEDFTQFRDNSERKQYTLWNSEFYKHEPESRPDVPSSFTSAANLGILSYIVTWGYGFQYIPQCRLCMTPVNYSETDIQLYPLVQGKYKRE